jgi:hypothetical protein
MQGLDIVWGNDFVSRLFIFQSAVLAQSYDEAAKIARRDPFASQPLEHAGTVYLGRDPGDPIRPFESVGEYLPEDRDSLVQDGGATTSRNRWHTPAIGGQHPPSPIAIRSTQSINSFGTLSKGLSSVPVCVKEE